MSDEQQRSHELSAEDRARIYEEERARHEARQSLEQNAKKPTGSCAKMALIVFVLLFLFAIIGMVNSDDGSKSGSGSTSGSPTRSSAGSATGVGDEGKLVADGDSKVFVASEQATLDEISKASIAKDTVGINLILLSGKVFAVPNNTRVRVLDKKYLKNQVQVRISEGDHALKAGWVFGAYVKPL